MQYRHAKQNIMKGKKDYSFGHAVWACTVDVVAVSTFGKIKYSERL